MGLTIKEVSEKFNIPSETLRYYERVGVIPPVTRTASGIRNYQEEDLVLLITNFSSLTYHNVKSKITILYINITFIKKSNLYRLLLNFCSYSTSSKYFN
mgnify:CR=1 FL=1